VFEASLLFEEFHAKHFALGTESMTFFRSLYIAAVNCTADPSSVRPHNFLMDSQRSAFKWAKGRRRPAGVKNESHASGRATHRRNSAGGGAL
jgi:hypothetical protein